MNHVEFIKIKARVMSICTQTDMLDECVIEILDYLDKIKREKE